MSEKIDLDELELKAREASSTDDDRRSWSGPVIIMSPKSMAHIAANSPPVTLALIARIAELEAAVESAADDLAGVRMAHRAAILTEILEKGVVLP